MFSPLDEVRTILQPQQNKKEGPEKLPPTKFWPPSSLTNGNTINDPHQQGAFIKCQKEDSQAGEFVTVLSVIRKVRPNPAYKGFLFITYKDLF